VEIATRATSGGITLTATVLPGHKRAFQPELWLGVEFRHLAALQAVAEESSFNRAGARLGYTQSAISQQIAALERIVGVRLVERRGGPLPVRLTPAGDLLLEHSAAIGSRLAAAFADMNAIREGTLGKLRVGTVEAIGRSMLPQALLEFRRLWHGIEIELTELQSDRALLCLLEAGDLDLAVVHAPVLPGPFDAESVFGDEYTLVGPTSCRDDLEGLTLERLARLPFVGFRSSRCCESAVSYFAAHGLTIEFVVRADNSRTVQGLVAAGFGYALIPAHDVDESDPRTQVIKLDVGLPRRVIAACWQNDRTCSEANQHFVRMLASVCRRSGARRRAAA
jgi:DNA-binding transcriptional LysR family regulator